MPNNSDLAAIDGKLTSEVKFFGGIFGHLEKGGTFNVEQKEVAPRRLGSLRDARAHERKGAALQNDRCAGRRNVFRFQPVPPETSLEQAAQRLKDTPAESTEALAVN